MVELCKSGKQEKLHIVRGFEDSSYQFCTIGSLRWRKLNSARERRATTFVAKMFFERILKRNSFLLLTIL